MRSTTSLEQKIDALSSHQIFSRHTREDLAPLADISHWRRHKRGELVFRQGEAPHHAHIVQAGRVKVFMTSASGQVFSILIAGPGNTLHAVACFGPIARVFTAQAMTDVRLLAIPAGAFVEFVIRHPKCAQSTINVMASHFFSVTQRIMDLIEEEVSQRILNSLTLLCERFGADLPLNNVDLAELAGTTRETTVRVLSRLSEMGILLKHRGRIEILDLEQLKTMASGRKFII